VPGTMLQEHPGATFLAIWPGLKSMRRGVDTLLWPYAVGWDPTSNLTCVDGFLLGWAVWDNPRMILGLSVPFEASIAQGRRARRRRARWPRDCWKAGGQGGQGGSIPGASWQLLGAHWKLPGGVWGTFWVRFGSGLRACWERSRSVAERPGSVCGTFGERFGGVSGALWERSECILGAFWVRDRGM